MSRASIAISSICTGRALSAVVALAGRRPSPARATLMRWASWVSRPVTAAAALVCNESSTRSGRRSARRCPSAPGPAAVTAVAATSPACARDRTGTEAHSVPSRYRQPMSCTAAEAAVRESGVSIAASTVGFGMSDSPPG
ncbi:MAG: hypothetical protein ACYCO9_07400 [Streptosporangiaceae bacterium]